MSANRKVFVALLVLSVVQTFLYYPQVPEVMASHFDGAGHPNGWMPKTAFFCLHLAMMAIMTLSFLFLPRSLNQFPIRTWSLPRKDYWLSPERREATQRFIQDQMLLFGIATLVLLIVIIQLAIEANLNPPPTLSSITKQFLVGYFVFTAAWLMRFFYRFARAPAV
ncbi:MAG: DUF1648 domain-containing protein [Candidatus Krumholzibacteria bacterium]|nr:DUF1648 domain-containing protein [Candidatus Krumholzibacteria bacterium]